MEKKFEATRSLLNELGRVTRVVDGVALHVERFWWDHTTRIETHGDDLHRVARVERSAGWWRVELLERGNRKYLKAFKGEKTARRIAIDYCVTGVVPEKNEQQTKSKTRRRKAH